MEPEQGSSKLDEREEVAGRFFVACGDPAVVLQSVHTSFGQIAAPILFLQQEAPHPAATLVRNDRGASPALDVPDELVAVISLVGDDVFRFVVRQKSSRLTNVVDLTRR